MQECPDLYGCQEGHRTSQSRWQWTTLRAASTIDSILDMEELFDGIPLDKVSVSMTMNGAVLPVIAMYVAAAETLGAVVFTADALVPLRSLQVALGDRVEDGPRALLLERLVRLRIRLALEFLPQFVGLVARAVGVDHVVALGGEGRVEVQGVLSPYPT